MYKIYADNTLIYDSTLEDYKIGKGDITLEIGKAGSFVFSMYPENPFYDRIVKMKTVITVYRENDIIFRGRALKSEDGFFNCRVVTCEGDLNFLLDSVIRPYTFSGSPRELLTKIINEHNSQVDESKRFEVGLVTVADNNNYIARSNSKYQDALTNINDHLLKSDLGGYLFITHNADGKAVINYYGDFIEEATQSIEFGENLKDYTKTTDSESIATVLIPLGAKIKNDDNDTEERLTIASVNNGLDYIEDAEAIKTYGRIIKVYEWDDVTEASNLLTKGRNKLTELIYQNVTIALTAIDLHLLNKKIESIGYGMYIGVKSEPHNLDVNMLCTKQTINLLRPDNDTYTLGYSYNSLVEATVNESHKQASENNKTLSEVANIYKTLNAKSGMYFSETTLSDGSMIYYLHDKPDLTKSTVIWKMTAEAIAISTDGGATYAYGLTSTGDAILNRIYTKGLNADYIKAGTLSADRIDLTELFAKYIEATNIHISGTSTFRGEISAENGLKIYDETHDNYGQINMIKGGYEVTYPNAGGTWAYQGSAMVFDSSTFCDFQSDWTWFKNAYFTNHIFAKNIVQNGKYLDDTYLSLYGGTVSGNLEVTGDISESGVELSKKYLGVNNTAKKATTADQIYADIGDGTIQCVLRPTGASPSKGLSIVTKKSNDNNVFHSLISVDANGNVSRQWVYPSELLSALQSTNCVPNGFFDEYCELPVTKINNTTIRKVGDIVHLNIVVTATILSKAYTDLFRLPDPTLYPPVTITFPVTTSGSANGIQCFCEITNTGTVRIYNYGDSALTWANINNTWITA